MYAHNLEIDTQVRCNGINMHSYGKNIHGCFKLNQYLKAAYHDIKLLRL